MGAFTAMSMKANAHACTPLQTSTLRKPARRGTIRFTTALFGMSFGGLNTVQWSLAPFQTASDGRKCTRQAGLLRQALDQRRVRHWYAPIPSDFNGRVVHPRECVSAITIGDHTLYRGVHADGVAIQKGSGYLLSAAGCPIIVASDGETLIAAHAGLKSLIRWDASALGHQSVVRSIACSFKRPQDVHAWVFFSIRPERYTHSRADERYRAESTRILDRLTEKGYEKCIGAGDTIDLPALIRTQLRGEGIICENRDQNCYLAQGAYDSRLPAPLNTHRHLIMVTHDAD